MWYYSALFAYIMFFFFSLQLENPTNVLTVGGVTSSAALLRSTRSDVTTTSSAWGCRTASTQVGVGGSRGAHFASTQNLLTYFTLSAGLALHATAVFTLLQNFQTGQVKLLPFPFKHELNQNSLTSRISTMFCIYQYVSSGHQLNEHTFKFLRNMPTSMNKYSIYRPSASCVRLDRSVLCEKNTIKHQFITNRTNSVYFDSEIFFSVLLSSNKGRKQPEWAERRLEPDWIWQSLGARQTS